jgi:serine/threonine protein kinase
MLATGRPPFDGEEFSQIKKLVKKKVKFDSREDKHIPKEARKFVECLLERDPEKRPSAEEALKMPWISQTLHKERRDSAKSVVPGAVLKSLKSFASQTALKRTALLLMAHHIAGKDLVKLRAHFESLDKDGSGRITMDELKHGLELSHLLKEDDDNTSTKLSDVQLEKKKNMEHNQVTKIGTKELNRIFGMLDQDQTGRIQLTQFMVRCVLPSPLNIYNTSHI